MAKRIVDGAGVWRSDKLAKVEPEWVRAEYANLLPLALANGSFELNSRRIWSDVYSYNRQTITLEKVEKIILPAFQRVGMLFTWIAEGKLWGFWTGIKKQGRLPSQSRLDKRHESVGPEPPADELAKYLESMNGQPVVSQGLANGWEGSGSGSGSLLSQEKASCDQKDSSKKAKKETKDSRYSEAARRLAQFLLVRVAENLKRINAKSKLLDSDKEQHAGVKRWTPDIELMLRLDGYSEAEVRALIEWAQADSFWWKNIRSGRKLRAQAEELSVRMKDEQAKKAAVGGPPKPLDQQYSELARRRAGQVH